MSASTAGATAGAFSIFGIINPFNYLFFLASSLLLFFGYLILPKGVRAQYCGAARRRYRRQRKQRKISAHQSTQIPTPSSCLPPADILDSIYAYSHSFSPQEHVDKLASGSPASSNQIKSEILSTQASALDSVWSGIDESIYSEGSASKFRDQQHLFLPQHLKMMLQQPPGIKFIAHGTKCRPRSVWITLHCDVNNDSQSTATAATATPPDYRNCLTWRAELKPSSASKKSPTSPASLIPPKLGNLRKVELMEVLGVEVGKRTTALRRVQTAKGLREHDCFSLLTKTGTLDLECAGLVVAGSRSSAQEVRAAFIARLALAMSLKRLRLNGLRAMASPSALQSKLNGISPGSAISQLDERTIFTGLMSEANTISTVSF